MKYHLQCTEVQESNFSRPPCKGMWWLLGLAIESPCTMRWTTVNIKYCPCLTKQILRFIGVAHKTSFTLRRVTNIFLQTHQIVCLLREIHCFPPSGIFNVLPIRPWSDPKNPTTTNCTAQGTLRGRQEQILLKNATLLAPAICCACHDQRHLNFTNYQCCTCRQKKPINFTKCAHANKKKNK